MVYFQCVLSATFTFFKSSFLFELDHVPCVCMLHPSIIYPSFHQSSIHQSIHLSSIYHPSIIQPPFIHQYVIHPSTVKQTIYHSCIQHPSSIHLASSHLSSSRRPSSIHQYKSYLRVIDVLFTQFKNPTFQLFKLSSSPLYIIDSLAS